MSTCWLQVVLAAMLACSSAAGPPMQERERREKMAALAREAGEAFQRRDWAGAEATLRQELELSADDPVASYNLACAMGAQGKDASEALTHAIGCGYNDIRRMRRDPLIAEAVKSPPVQRLFADWPTTLAHMLEGTAARSAKLAPKAQLVRETELKIAYLSSFDGQSTELSRGKLRSIARWAEGAVLTKLSDEQEMALDPWVLVVLPNRVNFNTWAAETYGGAARGGIAVIGGAYDNDTKRLVAQDLGGTLRHEFMHVLHWRDMTRRGQTHPIWLQEGLCSLAEDYDLTGKDLETGSIAPAHSWRTNAVIRLARSGRLQSIQKLLSMAPEGFSGSRPLASYAEARTLMMYLLERGKLREWYAYYVAHFKEDATGVKAFEATLGMPLEAIEKDYRQYVRGLREVAENVPTGGASMGVEVTVGVGEGPVISRTYGHPLFRSGDTLVTLDGRPVRDSPELVRLLQLRTPGDKAVFTVRRGKVLVEIPVELAAK